jgi:hypothetical protein
MKYGLRLVLLLVLGILIGMGVRLYYIQVLPRENQVAREGSGPAATEGVLAFQEPRLPDIAWDADDFITVDADGASYTVKLVVDGEPILEPIAVRDKKGKLLTTAVMSVRGYYRDKTGVVNSVIFPQILKNPNGSYYFIASATETSTSDDELQSMIQEYPGVYNYGTPGLMAYAVFSPDIALLRDQINVLHPGKEVPAAYNSYLELVDVYNQVYRSEIDSFLATGTASIEILLATGVGYGQGEVSSMYMEGI